MNQDELQLHKLAWTEALTKIGQVNPTLSQLLVKCDKQHDIFLVNYDYGQTIFADQQFYLPTKQHRSLAFSQLTLPNSVFQPLSYGFMPLGLALNKQVECYFETDQRVMPVKLYPAGELFCLSDFFGETTPTFNLSAGARSVFMLPKIADAVAHNRLKQDYGITIAPPKHLINQHAVFSELVQLNLEQADWVCTVILFSKAWLDEKVFINYLYKQAWADSAYAREQTKFHAYWEQFSAEVTRRKLKPKPYIINTLKHLLAITQGIYPAFTATEPTNSDALPVEFIQTAYANSYQLKKYLPTIMQPKHYQAGEQAVYYSLALPTLLEYAPTAGNARSIMTDLRELKQLIRIFITTLDKTNLNFQFFHTDTDKLAEIALASTITSQDLAFNNQNNLLSSEKVFADNSPFFRGCVQIH